MATDLNDLKFFWDLGVDRGASHMVIVYDGWDDYPVYAMPGEDPRDKIPAGTRPMECYKYSLGWESQSREVRANHWEIDASLDVNP